MKITLLCGNFENPKQHGYALERINNQLLIDFQLEKLLSLNYEVDVVLGYKYSEEVLKLSQHIRRCNLIFDPNEESGSPLSNLFAGLYSLYGEGFFLPVQYLSPSLAEWQHMIQKLYRSIGEGYQLLRPYCPIQGFMAPGYPLGISRSGKNTLMNHRRISKFEEAGLAEYKMPILNRDLSQPCLGAGQNLSSVG